MKLYIIGNGFDMAHGLPTGYWDFRNFLERIDYNFLTAFEAHYDIYPGMNDDDKKNLLWNELETNLANIDEDIIIEDAISMEMYLESGDVGIEDTLYEYFSEEYQYIKKLSIYLKRWIRTIRIRDVLPRVSVIDKMKHDLFVNFNYTATLENVYHIANASVIHIHGSLRDYTDDPILGHGNFDRIEGINEKKIRAEENYDEKEISICRVIQNYYETTLKDVNRYMMQLSRIGKEAVSEVVVAGHSLTGIDMPYFAYIDSLTKRKLVWKVIWFDAAKVYSMKQSLMGVGVEAERISMIPANEFYDLTDENDAKRKAFEIKHGF